MQPGWYWIRGDPTDNPEMVKVYEQDGVLCVAWLEDHLVEVVEVSGEWAGPIDRSA
jgi:hypothetical protein